MHTPPPLSALLSSTKHAPGVLATLRLLLQARDYAEKLKRSVWDFAEEIDSLRFLGLRNADVRWLVCSGYVEHAAETTAPGAQTRTFRTLAALTVTPDTCVALTEAGVAFARTVCRMELDASPHIALGTARVAPSAAARPCWDCHRRELRLGSQVAKRFKQPAPNQELIATVFEEDGWPPRIDDPLPVLHGIDAKVRLHDTIKNLNHQDRPLIRFRGDGTGRGVCWELLF